MKRYSSKKKEKTLGFQTFHDEKEVIFFQIFFTEICQFSEKTHFVIQTV